MLNAIVVGAGLGGITTAIALRRRGHRVTVLEKIGKTGDVGAGIQLAPNATRVLDNLRVLDAVREKAVVPDSRIMRRWNDGSIIHRKDLGATVHDAYGYPYLVTHRADLLETLLRMALEPAGDGDAVQVEMGHTVVDVTTVAKQALVRTAAGQEWRADVVIGADGVHSTARRCIGEPDDPAYSGESCWIGNIPSDRLRGDVRALAGVDTPATGVWLGPGRHVVHYPVRTGSLVTFGATMPAEDSIESYTAGGDLRKMIASLDGWDERLLELLSNAREVNLVPLRVRPPLNNWTAGHVALMGDACHPMLPYQAQGAAQGMEDAAVLADCLAEIEDSDDVPGALKQYESSRKGRATAVQAASSNNSQQYHTTGDAEQKKRDERLAAMGGNPSLDWEWLWRALPTAQPPTAAGTDVASVSSSGGVS